MNAVLFISQSFITYHGALRLTKGITLIANELARYYQAGRKGWSASTRRSHFGRRTATLLLDSSVAIESVQDLLDHKHIITTQIYDKRRRSVRDSASHKEPI